MRINHKSLRISSWLFSNKVHIQYEPEDLQKAINDCNNKNISPYNRGKPSTFTHDEEKVMVDYFVALSKF